MLREIELAVAAFIGSPVGSVTSLVLAAFVYWLMFRERRE